MTVVVSAAEQVHVVVVLHPYGTAAHLHQAYILEGVAANIRGDGRGKDDFRPFSLNLTSAFSNTNGAARVQLSGGTDVVVGVKLEVGAPRPDTPEQGRLEVCTPPKAFLRHVITSKAEVPQCLLARAHSLLSSVRRWRRHRLRHAAAKS